jgi:hypothetical protein
MRMNSRTVLAALVAVSASLVAACAPAGGGAAAAPNIISGDGHYDLLVLNNGVDVVIDGTWEATYGFTRIGSVYSGPLDSTDDNQDRYVDMTVAGGTITNIYTREPLKNPGEGLELDTSDVVAATVTDAAECPGVDAIELTITGAYTFNGAPSTLSADPVVYTVCDAAAAAYFG